LHRRNRAGLKRIGLLALALVIALGAMGVGYAAWTDSVYVTGTVNTGTLNINVLQSISMFVYKVPGAEDTGYGPEIVVVGDVSGPNPPGTPPAGGTLIASAAAAFVNGVNDTDEASVAFNGLFPGMEFKASWNMWYVGSIPVKISVATILDPSKAQDATLVTLWQMGETTKNDTTRYGIWIDGVLTPHATGDPEDKANMLGIQLHQLDYAYMTLHVRLPDDPAYEDLSLDFTGTVTVVQWNEY